MKGDFSTWRPEATDDHLGVLYQQGRLISDADLTEAEILALIWRITAGRDIIGANIAAAPAENPNGFRVERALVDGNGVLVHLHPGRIWADGLHLTLHPDPANPATPVVRSATYLPPPHNPLGTGTADIGNGVRDAVILETSLETLNGFQDPQRLIEAALGGPDTAERIIPRTALRLLRLDEGETCANIGGRLRDDLSAHGRLTVSLEPTTVIAGDCPEVEGGGYSGFEHNLYRIEIAQTNGGPPLFKWSQFNGGLVGRGRFHGGGTPNVEITANRTAILTSGIINFYLEALEWNDEAGNWQLVYATTAALNADGELDLSAPPSFGTIPGSANPVFFRLWNGLRNVSDFTDAASPVELRDGIRLAFDPPPGATYRPGSWWNFDVRAGEIVNPQVLLDNRPPEGPVVRRVPLAEIQWTNDEDTDVGGTIEDCRRRFRPLTNQKICCTYIVGNGLTCFGDFNSLEEAAKHLPPQGGKLCLLPGIHYANLELLDRRCIQIHGCRHRTFVFPRINTVDQPIIRVQGGLDIQIADLDLIATFGMAIDLEGSEETPLNEVVVSGCRIMALTFGIHVETANDVTILDNQIWLLDHPRGISTISIRATGALIEKNRTGVWPFEYKPPRDDGDDGDDDPDPADPCIESDELFDNIMAIVAYVSNAWLVSLTAQPPTQHYRARGGIHLKGGSERIDLRRNRITGGLGHGITLGGVFPDETAPGTPPDDGGDSGLPNPTVRGVGGGFVGVVLDADGTRQAGATVRLSKGSAAPLTAVTDANGEVKIKAADGAHQIEIDSGLEIQTISTTALGAFLLHAIIVAPAEEKEVSHDEAFLTRIRILDNEIERMGLSGIGFWFHSIEPAEPPVLGGNTVDDLAEFMSAILAPRELLRTTNIVRDLVIRRNRIENNLQIVFTDLLRAAARFAAQGGISLALVEGLRIEDNHITGNCPTAVNPCAGIFVGYGEEVLISGNYIAGNGPVTETYRADRTDGLRGGIFIRLASSVLQGATRDGQQKPALVIRDNVIDQPAGRAITALAYGPVSCVGNTLNAEHEGAWAVFDDIIGTILILNLGGIHRLAAFAAAIGKTLTDLVDVGDVAGIYMHGYNRMVEAILPGGETLFNSNRVRSGPDNRAWCSQMLVTADDLGFDGNQSSMFRPDVTFANTVGVAHSLRVTDNRFRERALYTAMSALTFTGGATVSGGARAMNITTQNQGDHCIIAMTAGGIPVEGSPNQVVHSQTCPDVGAKESAKRAFVLAPLLLAWRFSVNPQFDSAEGETAVDVALPKAVDQVAAFQMESQITYAAEAQRIKRLYGQNAPAVRELRAQVESRKAIAQQLEVQKDLLEIREADVPVEGTLLDGRVADAQGKAGGNLRVEFVTRDGEQFGPSATVNEKGYYAITIDEETRARLAARDDVFLRVTDASGSELSRTPKAIALRIDRQVRTDFELARPPRFSIGIDSGDIIFKRPDPQPPVTPGSGGRPTPVEPVRPPTPVQPGDEEPRQPVPRVPVEEINGVGPVIAERLRDAGIEDADSLLKLPDEKLRAIVGNGFTAIRENAKIALQNARRDDNG